MHPLEKKIRSLGRLATVLCIVYGVAWSTSIVVGTAVILGLLDFLLHYFIRLDDDGMRYLFLGLMLAATLTSCYCFLVPLYRRRWSDIQIAQRVERFCPALADRLSSSIEFLRQAEEDRTAGSPTLRRTVVAETSALLDQVDLSRLFRVRPALTIATVALLICVGSGTLLACSASARLAITRLSMPWRDVPWPRRNHLQFQAPPGRLAAGDQFQVRLVDRNGRMPDAVDFHYRFADDVNSHLKAMQPQGRTMVVQLENVERSFEYRATGGDDQTMQWHLLEVVDPPGLQETEITLHPPAYTGWRSIKSGGHIRALEGTRIEVGGHSAAALREVRAVCESQDGKQFIEGRLSENGTRFSIPSDPRTPWLVSASCSYWFELTDMSGLVGGKSQKWQIHATKDQPPHVTLERPQSMNYVTAEAVVPIQASVKDDIGIASIELRYLRSDRSDIGQQVILLAKGPEVAPPASTPMDGSPPAEAIQYDLDLTTFDGLTPGTSMQLHLAASDYKPQTNLSTTRRLLLLSKSEMEDRIAQRHTTILGQLSEALDLQRQARLQTVTLRAQLEETELWDRQDVDFLQSAELNQREVHRLLSEPPDGLQAQIDSLVADMDNNRLSHADLRLRLTVLSNTLRTVSQTHLPIIQRELVSALKDGRVSVNQAASEKSAAERSLPDSLLQSIGMAARHQEQVIKTLEQLVNDLARWDGFRRLAREIRHIRRQQADLELQTDEQRQRTIAQNLDELTARQQADLRRLSQQQLELSRRYDATRGRLQLLLDELAETDPQVAQRIEDALLAAGRQAIGGRMLQSGRDIRKNRLGQAIESQQHVQMALDELMDELANRPEHRLDRLAEKLQDAAAEIEGLREQLEPVQAGLGDHATAGSTEDRQRRLLQLARQQGTISQEAERIARQLRRLQAASASDAAQQGAQSLRRSSEAAAQGSSAEAQRDSAQGDRQLEAAQKRVEESLREVQQRLFQQQLVRFGQQVDGLVGRQRGAIDETVRLDQLHLEYQRWTEPQRESLADLSSLQRSIATDTAILAEERASAKTFSWSLRGAARQMLRAARQLDLSQTDGGTRRSQQLALSRLQHIAAALKRDHNPEDRDPESSSQEANGESTASGEILAELKLLELLQGELNRRTAQLQQARRQQGGRLTPAQSEELVELSNEQGHLADIMFELNQPARAQTAVDVDEPLDARPGDEVGGPTEIIPRETETAR